MPSTQPLPRGRTDGNVPTFSIKFCSSRLETAARGCVAVSALRLDRPQAPCASMKHHLLGRSKMKPSVPELVKSTWLRAPVLNGFYTTVCSNTDLKNLVFFIIEKCARQRNLPSVGRGPGASQEVSPCPKDRAGQDAARRGPSAEVPPALMLRGG